MPPYHASSTISLQWPSFLLLGWGLARPTCFETRAVRDAREEDDERRIQFLQAKHVAPPAGELTGDARLCGVWTYTAGDCDGCYLIGKHGSTMFYYEDGVTCRLFGILQEEQSGNGRYIVILSIGMLRIIPSAGRMISVFKPWNGNDWHPPVTSSRVVRDPALPTVVFPVGSRDRLASSHSGGTSPGRPRSYSSFISPIDFALAAQKVVAEDDRCAELVGRLGAIDQATSSYASSSSFASSSHMPFPTDGNGSGTAASGIQRDVDVSGKWEIYEKTSGKFIFSLKQNAAGALKGRGRSCDDPATDWSIEVHGRVECRIITWTEYVSKKRGRKPNQEAGRMTAIISPCGRYFGGFGSTEGREGQVPQQFAGVLIRSHRDRKEAESSTKKSELNLSSKLTLTKWGDNDAGEEEESTIRRAGSFVANSVRRTLSGSMIRSGSFTARSQAAQEKRESTIRSATPRGSRIFRSLAPRQPGEGEDAPLRGSDAAQSHRPGSKRAKVARTVRTAGNWIFGGGNGNRGSMSETAALPPRSSSSIIGSFGNSQSPVSARPTRF